MGVPSWHRNHRQNPFFRPLSLSLSVSLSQLADRTPSSYLVILNSAPCNPRCTSTIPLSSPSRCKKQLTKPDDSSLSLSPRHRPRSLKRFVRLNGLKRHTPAHLRAPVRARLSLSLSFSLNLSGPRFPFLSGRG